MANWEWTNSDEDQWVSSAEVDALDVPQFIGTGGTRDEMDLDTAVDSDEDMDLESKVDASEDMNLDSEIW